MSDLTNQKDQINSAYEKMKVDLSERDRTNRTFGAEPASSSSDAVYFKQQLDSKKREVDGLKDAMKDLKQKIK